MDLSRYGSDWGTYWWFCNLALLGMGIGLLFRNRGLLTGFLAIASFTQVFWLIDNLTRQVRGKGVFGLVDFMYRPGYPIDEFILSHYHYFTLPIALTALLYLPQKKNHTLGLIAFFNPFIFGISYFAFPASQNINCIHEACFPGLNWKGPLYALLFWGVCYVLHLGLGWWLDKFLLNLKITPQKQRVALAGFSVYCLMAFGFAVQDTRYKLTLPSFVCAPPEIYNGVRSGCQYTRLHHGGEFMLTYFVENTVNEGRFCKVKLVTPKAEKLLSEGVPLPEPMKILQNSLLDNPTEDTLVKIVADCGPMPGAIAERNLSQESH